MEENSLSFNDKKLYYRAIGKGPVVVLVHGFGEDGNIWHNQVGFLSQFRLLIPDLPGTGKSELPSQATMEGLADALRSIIYHDAAKTGDRSILKAAVIGHSMGGYVALAFARKYPELLKGLGLFHSTCYTDTEEKVQIRRRGIEFINQHGATAFLKTTIPNLYSQLTREKNYALIRQQIDASHNFSAVSLVCYYEAMIEREDQSNLLKNIRVPVIFILGKYDTAVPLQDGLTQCHLPDFSYIHILKNSGHMGMYEEPETANNLLYTYLKALELTQ